MSQVIEHRLPRAVVQLRLQNHQHTVLIAQTIDKIAYDLAVSAIIIFAAISARLSHFSTILLR